jgi:hypothetical protein
MIRTEAPDGLEGMKYGGQVYSLSDGTIVCGFTAQKNNLTFYVGRVPDQFRETLTQAGFRRGQGRCASRSLTPRSCNSFAACFGT